jgi:hypothetical protein
LATCAFFKADEELFAVLDITLPLSTNLLLDHRSSTNDALYFSAQKQWPAKILPRPLLKFLILCIKETMGWGDPGVSMTLFLNFNPLEEAASSRCTRL